MNRKQKAEKKERKSITRRYIQQTRTVIEGSGGRVDGGTWDDNDDGVRPRNDSDSDGEEEGRKAGLIHP